LAISDSPNAIARLTTNVSPPDKDFTVRLLSLKIVASVASDLWLAIEIIDSKKNLGESLLLRKLILGIQTESKQAHGEIFIRWRDICGESGYGVRAI
jgi:hypothetical protein